MLKLGLTLLSVTTALGLVHSPRQEDASRYTVCGGDRGYTERDSLLAAARLENKIVTSDKFAMEKDDCIFAHVNTTIVSLCNGNYRSRNINRAEVRRGINQLIQDCGLEGGFTGFHVVNNLTFAAYGVFGGINLKPPTGANPPDVPGGGSRRKRSLSKREDCSLKYNGVERTDCPTKFKLNEDGSCGAYKSLENNCEQFCEQTRMGLLGIETRAPGTGGQAAPVTTGLEVADGTEVSITNGFSIGVDGVFKDVIGAGLSYSWSITTTTSKTTTHTIDEKDIAHLTPEELKTTRVRWVYFPLLIKSCGTVSRSGKVSGGTPACGTSVCPPAAPKCGSEETRTEGVCILSPSLDPNGANQVIWTIRLEGPDGNPLPMDRQAISYQNVCDSQADPDGDGENECLNPSPARRAVDFVAMKREYERSLVPVAISA